MYTIGQVSEMFNIPVSIMRYYDKEGLFPGLERSSGIRRFSEKEIESLRIIECLKKTGMEIITKQTILPKVYEILSENCMNLLQDTIEESKKQQKRDYESKLRELRR